MTMLSFRPLPFFLICLAFFTSTILSAQADYDWDPDESHGILLLLSDQYAEVGEVTAEVAKYNLQHFGQQQLKLSRYWMPYLSKVPVVYISTFSDLPAAMNYYWRLDMDRPNFMQNGIIEKVLPVSKTNFNSIVLSESMSGYLDFFEEYYLPFKKQ